ncbi:Zinc-regulated transporter [Microdochium nivale]|nr:Zinc-regulated transporter [Microdochium nivale]
MARTYSLAAALLLAASAPLAAASRMTAYDRRQAAATPTPTATSMTAVSSCHRHATQVWCEFGTTEYQVQVPATMTGSLPASFTDCHGHGSDTFCVDPKGGDVEILGYVAPSTTGAAGGSSEGGAAQQSGSGESTSESSGDGNVHCHDHAGIPHCVGGSGSEEVQCEAPTRDYNIPLRIGMIFVVLVTSLIGVLGPILLSPILPAKAQVVLTVTRQFGTGIIISTAFIHLFTHANMMFGNRCVGILEYEGTTAAVVMAGIFIAWIVEYGSGRAARKYWSNSQYSDDVVSVFILEAGIIFHSILIGITVVVASDASFAGLLVVIVFHQMFEGIALGSRIAGVGQHTRDLSAGHGHAHALPTGPAEHKDSHGTDGAVISSENSNNNSETSSVGPLALSMPKKIIMGVTFAITTPIGMAIGTGVIKTFNGADKTTLIALGTLDAVSAGILIWVGVVEMWAGDWMYGGELANAGLATTLSAGCALVAGLILMSVLGKWA